MAVDDVTIAASAKSLRRGVKEVQKALRKGETG
jgi:ribosomal protein L7Ae-like RNA K-turn-binding protein